MDHNGLQEVGWSAPCLGICGCCRRALWDRMAFSLGSPVVWVCPECFERESAADPLELATMAATAVSAAGSRVAG